MNKSWPRVVVRINGREIGQFVRLEEEINMQCPVGMSLAEARRRNKEFIEQFGRAPASPDELVAYVAMRETELEEQRRIEEIRLRDRMTAEAREFVGVQFHGHGRVYTYKLGPGFIGTVGIGDYVAVFSPVSDQTELVRVVQLGKGSWTGGYKVAQPVEWVVKGPESN